MRLRRSAYYALWTLVPHIGRTWRLDVPQRVTVLLTYYHPQRAKHLGRQVQNLLKCDFVDRIVVSSHNPELDLDVLPEPGNGRRRPSERRSHARGRGLGKSPRVTVRREPVPRPCGHRWHVARSLDAEYVIVVDDDVLLFPWQLAKLFERLVDDPQSPHGVAGMLRLKDGGLEYHEREERTVDFLTEVYVVTRSHIARYEEIERQLRATPAVGETIDTMGDFLVISQAGTRSPRIHDVGRLLRCETFNQVGFATHRQDGFAEQVQEIDRALKEVVRFTAGSD